MICTICKIGTFFVLPWMTVYIRYLKIIRIDHMISGNNYLSLIRLILWFKIGLATILELWVGFFASTRMWTGPYCPFVRVRVRRSVCLNLPKLTAFHSQSIYRRQCQYRYCPRVNHQYLTADPVARSVLNTAPDMYCKIDQVGNG